MAANRSSKPPTTVKLTDSDVIAIVDSLRFYRRKSSNTDGSMREITALDEPALAPIIERREAIRAVELSALALEVERGAEPRAGRCADS